MNIMRDAGVAAVMLLAAGGTGAQQKAPAGALPPAALKAIQAYVARENAAAAKDHESVEMERSLAADLNGDGKAEVVAEINRFMGNSQFGRLVVFADDGKGWRKVAQSDAPLGQIERITASGGLIQVDSLRLGPKDSRCCPSVKKTTGYRWQSGKVVEAGVQTSASSQASAPTAAQGGKLPLPVGYYVNTAYETCARPNDDGHNYLSGDRLIHAGLRHLCKSGSLKMIGPARFRSIENCEGEDGKTRPSTTTYDITGPQTFTLAGGGAIFQYCQSEQVPAKARWYKPRK